MDLLEIELRLAKAHSGVHYVMPDHERREREQALRRLLAIVEAAAHRRVCDDCQ